MNAQFRDTQFSQFTALAIIFGIREHNLILEIVGILPDVGGVGFANVDNIESDLILVLLVQLIQSGNLPPKGRSSIAPEDEHDRFLATQGGQLEMTLVVRGFQQKIWRRIPSVQLAAARGQPEMLQREHRPRGPGDMPHRRGEFIRRLQHQSKKHGASEPVDHNDGDHYLCGFLHFRICSE
jgi:hypothetical protein